MFKYVWIVIIVGAFLLWGWTAVKDCIDVFSRHSYDNIFEFLDELDPSSAGFIILSLLIIIGASFYVWLVSLIR